MNVWRIIGGCGLLILVGVIGSTAQPSEVPLRLPPKPFEESHLKISYHKYTGKVNFLRAEPGHSILQPRALPESASPEEAARSFLAVHGSLFGLRDQAAELRVMRVKAASRGRAVVRFQQVYQGIPIIGGELMVQLDAARNILATNGEILPDLNIKTTPAIAADTARQTALTTMAEVYNVSVEELKTTAPELWIYDRAIMGGAPARGSRVPVRGSRAPERESWAPEREPQAPKRERQSLARGSLLVWRMDVRLVNAGHVNELVLIDAQTGMLVLHFNQIMTMQ